MNAKNLGKIVLAVLLFGAFGFITLGPGGGDEPVIIDGPIGDAAGGASLWRISSGVLLPVNNSWDFRIPSLGSTGDPCVTISDANGTFATSTCGAGGGASAWGDITGTLADQTDLQAALDALIAIGTTSVDSITTLSNLSITESQISDLSHYTSFNTDFDTRLAATTTLNNITTLGSLSITESQISDLSHTVDTNTQLSDEQVEDIVGAMLVGTETLISVTYQDGTGDIDFVVDNDLSNYNNGTSGFITSSALSPYFTLAAWFGTTSAPHLTTLANLSITESQVSDLTHYDILDFAGHLAGTTTDALSEGSTNLYNQTHTGEVTGATALTIADSVAVSSWTLTTPTLTSFFGTPCSGNEFLQDISDIGAFSCAAASVGSSLFTDGTGFVFPNDGDYIAAPFFHATSTTSTSTFAGGIYIATSTSIYGDQGDIVVDPAASLVMVGDRTTQNFIGDIQFHNSSSTTKTGLEWYDHLGNSIAWFVAHYNNPGAEPLDHQHIEIETSDTGGNKQGRITVQYDCDYDCLATFNQVELRLNRNSGQTNGNFLFNGGGQLRSTEALDFVPFNGLNTKELQISTSTNNTDITLEVAGDDDLYIGDLLAVTGPGVSYYSNQLAVGTSTADSTRDLTIGQNGASGTVIGPELAFVQTDTAINASQNSQLGKITFSGNDKAAGELGVGAQIHAEASSFWNATTNDYPADIVFSTTPDGASALAEVFRITSDGAVECTGCIDSSDIEDESITHADIADEDQEFTQCKYIESPTADDDLKSLWANKTQNDWLILEIWGESDQTVNFDLQVDDGTPADVNGTDISPAAGEAEDTSLSGDTTLAAGEELDLAVTSVSGSPTWVSICATFQTVD